jgi:hypothetical protein
MQVRILCGELIVMVALQTNGVCGQGIQVRFLYQPRGFESRRHSKTVLTTKTNNEYKPVAGLRCCRLTGLNATSLKGQWC